MEKKIRLDSLEDELKGKILIDLEYGWSSDEEYAEESGERYLKLPAKIKSAYVESRHNDPVIYFDLEGHEDVDDIYAHSNETITYRDPQEVADE